jgi:hypothetical protein
MAGKFAETGIIIVAGVKGGVDLLEHIADLSQRHPAIIGRDGLDR